jgi:hypothetical protein
MTKSLVTLALMERELNEDGAVAFAQPHHRQTPIPDYITPTPGVPDVGALTAATVGQMYEQAAQAFEAMGEQQKLVIGRCETVIAEAKSAMEEAKQAAEHLRDQGKQKFAEVESWGLLTQSVRESCAAFIKRVDNEV